MIINVKTRPAYPIHLGNNLFTHLLSLFDFGTAKLAFLCDSSLLPVVKANYSEHLIIPLDLSRNHKDLKSYSKVVSQLMDHDFSRDDYLVNVGGGTISDLGAFVAATYKRGIRFVNVATTTLAQVDASVGGKNGLDLFSVKNLVGSFYQPQAVIIDFDLLKSLPTRHYYNGLYEALKMGLLFSSQLLDNLDTQNPMANIDEIVKLSIIHKAAIVEQDEKEENLRRVLNFGHTLGHVYESLAPADNALLHGEAIMHGMLMMIDNPQIVSYCQRLIHNWDLPPLPLLDYGLITKTLANDKKTDTQGLSCILLKDFQDWEFSRLSFDQLLKRINRYEKTSREI